MKQQYCVDCDKTIKVEGIKIRCYSKKKMDELYKDETQYTLVGEIKRKNKKEPISELSLLRSRFPVSALDSNNTTLYKKAGYIKVGPSHYVAILKHRFAFLFWLFGLLGGIGCMTLVLLALLQNLNKPTVIDPDHPLPTEDSNAQTIPVDEDEDEKVVSQDGGGSVSMVYTLEAQVSLSSGEIQIYFRNPSASNHDVAIDLYIISGDQQIPIAQSGLIQAGYGLEKLTLLESVNLSQGVYEGKYVVHFYNPETGERALVEPEITDLTVTVTG